MSNITVEQILEVIRKTNAVKNADDLDTDKSLSDQGIDSLDFSGVLFNIEEAFDVTIPDKDIDGLDTINDIVAYLNGKN